MPDFPHGRVPMILDDARPIEGIDIGFPQGLIDWPRLGGVYRGELASPSHPDFALSFAYVRATAGASDVDVQFRRNAAGAEAEGVPFGCYHVAIPDGDSLDARTEADHFLRVTDGWCRVLRPMLDVEVRRKSLAVGEPFCLWVLDWLDRVNDVLGVRPCLYTGGPFWEETDGPGLPSADIVKRLRAYPLWLAAYVRHEHLARYVPGVWAGIEPAVWQRSGDVAVPPDVPLRLPGIGVSPGSNPVVDRDVLLATGGLNWLKNCGTEDGNGPGIFPFP